MKCFGYLDSGYITIWLQKMELWESLPDECKKKTHFCLFSISVTSHWFSFWTVFYFLPPTILSSMKRRSTKAYQTWITWVECVCCVGNFMRTDYRSKTFNKQDKRKLIVLWFRAHFVLMINTWEISVAKGKLIFELCDCSLLWD